MPLIETEEFQSAARSYARETMRIPMLAQQDDDEPTAPPLPGLPVAPVPPDAPDQKPPLIEPPPAPEPTTMAFRVGRTSCAHSSVCGPDTHRESPEAAAIRPSMIGVSRSRLGVRIMLWNLSSGKWFADWFTC